jgi:hypothetical protein
MELPLAMNPGYTDQVAHGYVVLGAAADDPRTSMSQVAVPAQLGPLLPVERWNLIEATMD